MSERRRRAFDARERLENRVRVLGVLCSAAIALSVSQSVLLVVFMVVQR